MKPSSAFASFRQLCCLGLPREALIAELLTAIQTVIPSTTNVFVGLGQNGLPCDVVPEFVIPEALEAYTAHLPRAPYTQAMLAKNLEAYRSLRIVDDIPGLWENFYYSDLYNLVWRPYGQYHCLQALVRDDHGPCGLLHLFRLRHSTPFSPVEKDLLDRLLIYIEHGLRLPVSAMTDFAESGRHEMLILDAQGTLLHASATARELLALASFPSYPIGTGEALPPEVPQICRNIQVIFQGCSAPRRRSGLRIPGVGSSFGPIGWTRSESQPASSSVSPSNTRSRRCFRPGVPCKAGNSHPCRGKSPAVGLNPTPESRALSISRCRA